MADRSELSVIGELNGFQIDAVIESLFAYRLDGIGNNYLFQTILTGKSVGFYIRNACADGKRFVFPSADKDFKDSLIVVVDYSAAGRRRFERHVLVYFRNIDGHNRGATDESVSYVGNLRGKVNFRKIETAEEDLFAEFDRNIAFREGKGSKSGVSERLVIDYFELAALFERYRFKVSCRSKGV